MLQILEVFKEIGSSLEIVSSVRGDWMSLVENKRLRKKIRKNANHTLFFRSSPARKWVEDHKLLVQRLHEFSVKWSVLMEAQDFNCPLVLMDDPIYFAPLFKTLIKQGIPVVAACQNLESQTPGQAEKKWVNKLFEEEMELLSQCSLVITISREEDTLLRNLGIPTRLLPYYPVDPILKRLLLIREKRNVLPQDGILMVGNSKNIPTREGMNSAIRHWEENHLEQIAGKLIIGGFQCEKYLTCPSASPGIEFHGTLTHEALDDFMCRVKGSLCYQPNGGGALTRICEMLIAGVPVLASSHAARSYYDLPGLLEFSTLDHLGETLKQLEKGTEPIPLPQAPEISPLISDIQKILK